MTDTTDTPLITASKAMVILQSDRSTHTYMRPTDVLHFTTSFSDRDACIFIHTTTQNRAYSQCYDIKTEKGQKEMGAALDALSSVLCSNK